ncbi:MAG: Gfo/Idh/MocA family oxidoreductase [Actinomycetota bacterium]
MSWGIVGTGTIASKFAVASARAGQPVAAVSSRSASTGQDFAARFEIPAAVSSIEELVALPQVRRIYVATPNERHRDDVLAGIAAGVPVLCEKPLAISAAEGRELVDAAQAAGVFLMEGLWTLCLPVYRDVLARLADGAIGEVREVEANFAVPHGPDTMPRLFDGPGAGALLDRGVYAIALARAVLGPELQLVHASGDLSSSGVDLAASLILESPTGARAVLSVAVDRMGSNRMAIAGTRGRITLEEPLANPAGFRVATIDPNATPSPPLGAPGLTDRITEQLMRRSTLRSVAKAALRRPSGAAGGLDDQIAHVEACLAAGRTESDWVPLSSSIAVLELIDDARAALAAQRA